MLFNFASEYAIRRIQVNQDGLKLNATHQHLVRVDGVNIMGGRIHAIKRNTEASVVASKNIGLKENADKTKYIVMSGDQNARRSRNINNDNRSFERGERFKYLETTLRNRNSVQEEIKGRLKCGNAFYHSGQNLYLSFSLFPNKYKY